MLTLTNVGFAFGGRFLYRNVNWQIHDRDKIGLIGANGTGKSTLLRLITKEYSCTEGDITEIRGLTIGFLNQDLLSYESDKSILQVAMEGFSNALQLEKEINDIIHQLETEYNEDLVYQMTAKQAEFERLGGYEMEHKSASVLTGLGFSASDLEKPLALFSGGWRMRVMLAKILLQQPNVLLLDEPTNHLDLPSIQWLEEYLRNYEGAVIIVSHDRYFLDKMVTKIAEVSQQKITVYTGNFAQYIESKEERNALQHAQFKNQQQKIKDLERFVERFKAKASKATQAQSRVKMLEKIERVEDVENSVASIDFQFKVSSPSGKDVMRLEDISKSYGDNLIFKRSDAILMRGDKIGLVGANGKGKSTLLRIIAGEEQHEGVRQEGYNVRMGFFAQHQLESLNLKNDIITELEQHAPQLTTAYLRTILGCFMFSGEDVFKTIKVLSGGEKSRVALAKTLISEANFLLLDEPTNHLDMISISMLVQALQNYEGTYVVVSHDRYFLEQVTNKIWYIDNQELKEFLGDYGEFDEWYKQRQEAQKLEDKKQRKQPEKEKTSEVKNTKMVDETQEKRKKITNIEHKIAEQELVIQKLEQRLAMPETYSDTALFQKLTSEYQTAKSTLNKMMEEWESYV